MNQFELLCESIWFTSRIHIIR